VLQPYLDAAALTAARQIDVLLSDVATLRARALGASAAGVARIMANDGGADQLRRAVDLLVSSSELRDDERRLPWLLVGPLFLRDSDTGDELRHAVDEVRRQAAVGVLPFTLFHVGRDEATTDRWSRAEATYTEGIQLARETGQTTDLAMSLAGLAWLLARQGRQDECRARIAEGMQLCLSRDIDLGRAWLLSRRVTSSSRSAIQPRPWVHSKNSRSCLDSSGSAIPTSLSGTRAGRVADPDRTCRRRPADRAGFSTARAGQGAPVGVRPRGTRRRLGCPGRTYRRPVQRGPCFPREDPRRL